MNEQAVVVECKTCGQRLRWKYGLDDVGLPLPHWIFHAPFCESCAARIMRKVKAGEV